MTAVIGFFMIRHATMLLVLVGFTGGIMQTSIVNIGQIISGDWQHPFTEGSSILVDGELISKVGVLTDQEIDNCDVVFTVFQKKIRENVSILPDLVNF